MKTEIKITVSGTCASGKSRLTFRISRHAAFIISERLNVPSRRTRRKAWGEVNDIGRLRFDAPLWHRPGYGVKR